MEQFREIGEVLGSIIKSINGVQRQHSNQPASMHSITRPLHGSIRFDFRINDSLTMRSNLRFGEKNTRWKILELMSNTLETHIKEVWSEEEEHSPSLSAVAVDLHSKRIHHGELNPSNILVKPRRNNHQSGDVYLQGKVFGFGLSCVKKGFSCSKSA